MKVEMQKCECLDKKAASKGDSRNKSQKKQRQRCGTGREQFTRKAGSVVLTATEFMERDSKREEPGIHRSDKPHLHDNLSRCKGKKEGKRKLIVLTP